MKIYNKNNDIQIHAIEVWKLLYKSHRLDGRLLNTKERDLLCEKMVERFEKTFFFDNQLSFFK